MGGYDGERGGMGGGGGGGVKEGRWLWMHCSGESKGSGEIAWQ